MKSGSFDAGADGEHTSVGLMAIPEIFATQDNFFDDVT